MNRRSFLKTLAAGGLLVVTSPYVYWTGADPREKPPANVVDFGAVGDGITDDSAAFHYAIEYGSTVYVPEGRYFMGAKT